MRNTLTGVCLICLSVSIFCGIGSCSKDLSSASTVTSSSSTSTSSTIAVSVDSTGRDSVYILQQCSPGFFRDSIAAGNLPGSITSFLNNNYAGYVFEKAFIIKDSTGTTGGYAVIIVYNGKPVALLFDASANFVQVLEQRQAGDLDGKGWHEGGRFGDRDGLQNDTVAISALPASIQSYFTTKYPGDTLTRVYRNEDSSYLVVSVDNGIFLSVFKSDGSFIKRIALPVPPGLVQPVLQDSLASSILSYLTTTYPGYVLEKAFSLSVDNILQGFIVAIDANNTKYVLLFDANGNFVAVRTIW